jgi:glycerol kinase
MVSDKSYILAIDQGTTGSTALLCDRGGRVISRGYREIKQFYPKPGWVESDPLEILDSCIAAATEAVQKASISFSAIKATGITNQRETTIVWDRKTGQPVYNAIIWQCRRTAPLSEELKDEGFSETVRQKTGLPIDAYFSGTKIRWILDNIPGGQARASSGDLLFGTVDTWLTWKMTGGKVHVTDFSNASRTMLFNINTMEWDGELLSMLNIPGAILPQLIPSSGIFGETVSGILGNSPITLASITGDQQAALFGEACFHTGMAKNTYGTGAFLMLNTGEKPVLSKNGMISTVAWGINEKINYALEGSIFISGAAVQWLRDGLKIINTAADTEEMARSVPDSNGVCFVPAFAGLGAPYWDMYARGTITGITAGVTRAHIARATLEAIAYQTRDVLEAMQADTQLKIPVMKVDGGGSLNNFLMQFQSDILAVPIQRTAVHDVTALGAAYLAGLAAGTWKNMDEIEKKWSAAKTFEPSMPASQRDSLYSKWKQAVESAKGWARP